MLMMLAAVAAELVLLLFVFLTVAVLRGRSEKNRDRDAMRDLVARVKQAKPQREQVIEKFLMQRMAMSGDALEQAKVAMLRAEMALVQRFVSIYRGRDADLAGRFDGDVIAALEPYHALSGTAAVAADEGGGGAVDNAELEALRKENGRLEDELRITMETMSRMLNEYSTMFAGSAPDHAAPIAGAAAAATVMAAEASADDVAEIMEPLDSDAVEVAEEPVVDSVADDDAVAAVTDPDDMTDDVDDLFNEIAEPVAEAGTDADADADAEAGDALAENGDDLFDAMVEPVAEAEADAGAGEIPTENVDDLFDELPEEISDIAPTDVADAPLDEAVDDIRDAEDLFDVTADPELPEQEPVLASESDIAAVADPAPAEAPEIDEDDPIAQILREAQSQEQSARGNPVDLPPAPRRGDAPEDVDPNPVSLPQADAGAAAAAQLEEGDIEVMTFAEDDIAIEVADEDLFDAVDIDAAEFHAPSSTEPAEDLFDPVDGDLKSGSGN
jgi:hypothetical protein